MISIAILVCVAALVASAPTETKKTIINVEGTDGQHIQTGEPGKAVSGYFTSRNSDGVEHRTMYVADENGFRATGNHLPVSSIVSPVQLPAAFPSFYPSYGYRYGPQYQYPFYYPNLIGGQYGSAYDYLSSIYDGGYRNSEDDEALTPEALAFAEEQLAQMTPEQVAVLTERIGPLGFLMLNSFLTAFVNIICSNKPANVSFPMCN